MMIETIPASRRDDYMRTIVVDIVEHYETDPDPDRVYMVDAPGGVIGQQIIERSGLKPGPQTPAVWAAWSKDDIRGLIDYDPSPMNLAWFASSDIKVYMMTDGLKPWFFRIPLPEPEPVRGCPDGQHRIRRISSN